MICRKRNRVATSNLLKANVASRSRYTIRFAGQYAVATRTARGLLLMLQSYRGDTACVRSHETGVKADKQLPHAKKGQCSSSALWQRPAVFPFTESKWKGFCQRSAVLSRSSAVFVNMGKLYKTQKRCIPSRKSPFSFGIKMRVV